MVAERESSTIILSNDPDADRLSVAEKQPCGSWRVFTGDEVGYLLAYYLATGLFSNSDSKMVSVTIHVMFIFCFRTTCIY